MSASGHVLSVSGRLLTVDMGEMTVGDLRLIFEDGDTWRESVDRTLSVMCPVRPTGVSS